MKILKTFLLITIFQFVYSANLPIKIFPMDNYPQQIKYWVNTEGVNDTPLVSQSYINKHFNLLKSHYFGTGKTDQSPWSENFVSKILKGSATKNIYLNEVQSLSVYNNQNKSESNLGYGINYLPYEIYWSNAIAKNSNVDQFKQLSYDKSNLAIATINFEAYAIPTSDQWFLSYTKAGEGFPFNNTILSNIYIGTPLYVIGNTLDKQWSLVLTPQFIGWVKTMGVGYIDSAFISKWKREVDKSLLSVITPNTTLINRHDIVIGSAYAGTILPVDMVTNSGIYAYIPVRSQNGDTTMSSVFFKNDDAVIMPLKATRDNMIRIISKLMGRTYGWGGFMGYNDCSAELQAIFTPFGYFMPRNSAQQVNVGNIVDLSNQTPSQKSSYILNHASPFMTLIYIKGHIMLYVGKVKIKNQIVPVIYEDAWGMSPSDRSMRYIIGKSVFFPLLEIYPEVPEVVSPLDRNIFKLSDLNGDFTDIDMLNILY